MRISKQPEDRKNEILDVAEKLFTTKGYSKTTINHILEEIGIAKGTFYYYFKSKEEVLDGMVMRIIEKDIMKSKEILFQEHLNAPEKLFQILTTIGPESGEKEGITEQLHEANNAEMQQKIIVETVINLTPILAKVIEQGIQEGFFSTPYPKESMEVLLITAQFLLDGDLFKWTPEEMKEKMIAFVYFMEVTLGAKKGTFDYLIKRY